MKRYKITHHTIYTFSEPVELRTHTLRLRPRDGHELRIESSKLDIFPNATKRWHRDVEGNSVLNASFSGKTKTLSIKSEILIQHYDLVPLDFLVADYAVNYPFQYLVEDKILLAPYLGVGLGRECGVRSAQAPPTENVLLYDWIARLWQPAEKIQSVALLLRLNRRINDSMEYRQREEEGVQSAEQTLTLASGSCRDFANLFMVAAQRLGFAARFVSGYLFSENLFPQPGSTHAWVEVFIPGAGWKGFDPTIGDIVGSKHIAVAVARVPESVSPVAGSFFGAPGSSMSVNVWVADVT